MPRKRAYGNLLPWLSAKRDGKEKRFVQIGNSLLLSPHYHALTSGAQILYIYMALEAGGKSTVAFSRSTARKYGINKNSFARQAKELIRHGYIAIDIEASYARYAPTVYRFVFDWKTSAPEAGT